MRHLQKILTLLFHVNTGMQLLDCYPGGEIHEQSTDSSNGPILNKHAFKRPVRHLPSSKSRKSRPVGKLQPISSQWHSDTHGSRYKPTPRRYEEYPFPTCIYECDPAEDGVLLMHAKQKFQLQVQAGNQFRGEYNTLVNAATAKGDFNQAVRWQMRKLNRDIKKIDVVIATSKQRLAEMLQKRSEHMPVVEVPPDHGNATEVDEKALMRTVPIFKAEKGTSFQNFLAKLFFHGKSNNYNWQMYIHALMALLDGPPLQTFLDLLEAKHPFNIILEDLSGTYGYKPGYNENLDKLDGFQRLANEPINCTMRRLEFLLDQTETQASPDKRDYRKIITMETSIAHLAAPSARQALNKYLGEMKTDAIEYDHTRMIKFVADYEARHKCIPNIAIDLVDLATIASISSVVPSVRLSNKKIRAALKASRRQRGGSKSSDLYPRSTSTHSERLERGKSGMGGTNHKSNSGLNDRKVGGPEPMDVDEDLPRVPKAPPHTRKPAPVNFPDTRRHSRSSKYQPASNLPVDRNIEQIPAKTRNSKLPPTLPRNFSRLPEDLRNLVTDAIKATYGHDALVLADSKKRRGRVKGTNSLAHHSKTDPPDPVQDESDSDDSNDVSARPSSINYKPQGTIHQENHVSVYQFSNSRQGSDDTSSSDNSDSGQSSDDSSSDDDVPRNQHHMLKGNHSTANGIFQKLGWRFKECRLCQKSFPHLSQQKYCDLIGGYDARAKPCSTCGLRRRHDKSVCQAAIDAASRNASRTQNSKHRQDKQNQGSRPRQTLQQLGLTMKPCPSCKSSFPHALGHCGLLGDPNRECVPCELCSSTYPHNVRACQIVMQTANKYYHHNPTDIPFFSKLGGVWIACHNCKSEFPHLDTHCKLIRGTDQQADPCYTCGSTRVHPDIVCKAVQQQCLDRDRDQHSSKAQMQVKGLDRNRDQPDSDNKSNQLQSSGRGKPSKSRRDTQKGKKRALSAHTRYLNAIGITEMSMIRVMVGHDDNKGAEVLAVQDSGATTSCISLDFWETIPNRHKIRVFRTRNTVTVANQETIPIIYEAHPVISFLARDGRSLCFTHRFFVIENLEHSLYLGNDILSNPYRTPIVTPDTLVLSSNTKQRHRLVLPKDSNYFEIPIINPNNSDSHLSHLGIKGKFKDLPVSLKAGSVSQIQAKPSKIPTYPAPRVANGNRKRSTREFQVGDLVFMYPKVISNNSGLTAPKRGPYRTEQISSHSHTALLRELATDKLVKCHFTFMEKVADTNAWPQLSSNWDSELRIHQARANVKH